MMSKERELLERWLDDTIFEPEELDSLMEETRELLAQPEQDKAQAVMPNGACVSNVYDAYEEGRKSVMVKQEPVGIVRTIGGYPDDSEHIVEWLCKYKDLKEGDKLYLAPPIPKTTAEPVVINENTSDGYHTFKELYEFRKAYNVALFNEWGATGKYHTHKSWRHNNGEMCFGGGWFIVVAVLPQGQISNHYEAKDWNLFAIPEVEKALFEFDGHTGADVVERLKLYTAPPKRESLSDAQIAELWGDKHSGKTHMVKNFARAIEKAHGIGGGE